MNAAGRLGLYAAGAGVAFAAAFTISAAVVPDAVAAGWNHEENVNGHDGHSAVADTASAPAAPAGVSLAAQGYVLAPVTAPASAGEEGELAGATGDLTVTVTRDGQPVTTLEPYLGAFGHLVALREGDLAYLHVHAEGDEPEAGETSGPEVEFMIEAPTAGRDLLYLDFRVDGVVHTAAFVLEAGVAASTPVDTPAQTPTPSPSGHSH